MKKLSKDFQEQIYDALDRIRSHPVINDFLYQNGVDSERWYQDSGRILENLAACLIRPSGEMARR